MADLVIQVRLDANSIKGDSQVIRKEISDIGEESTKSVKKTESLAKVDYSNTIKQLNEVKKQMSLSGVDLNQIKQVQQNLSNVARIDYNSPEFKKKTEAFKKSFQEIKQVQEEVKNTTENTTKSVSSLGNTFSSFVGNIAASGFQMLISYAVQATSAMINYGLSLNSVEKKFANIIGNAQTANQHLKDLRSFSLQQGADENWVIGTAKDFERLRVPSSQVLSIIKAIGDSVAGTGGDEKNKQAIASTLVEVVKTRKATLETIQSLENAGILQSNIWESLRNETGKTNEELYNLAKTGKLTSEVFIQAYKDMANVKFADKMKDESETLAGSLSTLATAYKNALYKGLSGAGDIVNYGGWIQNAAKWIKAKEKLSVGLSGEARVSLGANDEFNAEIYAKQLERQKDALSFGLKDRLSLITNFQKIEESQLNSHLRLTSQDEINYLQKQKQIKESGFKNQISLQTSYFNQALGLAKGDEKETLKLVSERNQTLRGLNTELIVNELNTQKQITEAERRILEQRRQNSIQFKQLQIRELSLSADSRGFDLNRSISLGVNVQQSFNQLKTLTAQNYQQIVEITKESYAIQLENERLNAGERINLTKTMYLDLQNLAEQNRQKQIEIEDRQFNERIRKIDLFASKSKAQIDFASGLLGQLDFSNKGSVVSVMTSQFFNFDDVDLQIQRLKAEISATKTIKDSLLANIEKAEPKSTRRNQLWDLFDGQEIKLKNLQESLNSLEFPSTELNKGLLDLMRLGKQFDEGKISIDDFDKAQRTLLKTTQEYTMFGLEQQRKALEDKVKLFQQNNRQFEAFNAQIQLDSIKNQIDETKLRNSAESLNLYRNSFEGLRETLQKFQSGDKKTWLEFYDNLRKQDISNQINQIKELAIAQDKLSKSTQINTLAIRAQVYEHLAQAKSLSESIASGINQTYDAVVKKATSALDKLNEKTKGYLAFLIEPLKAIQEKTVSNIFGNIVDKLFPGFSDLTKNQTSNPISKPIVAEINQSNIYLKKIAEAVTKPISVNGGNSSNRTGVSTVGDLINVVSSGGNLGNRNGINSPYIFNSQPRTGDIVTLPNGEQAMQVNGNNSSPYTKIKQIFGKGGIFGKDGFGWNSGTVQGIGGLAGFAGDLVGGSAGTILSGVSTGIGTASSLASILGISALGGPIGLAIGGIIGGIVGLGKVLFGRNKQRRADEKIRNDLMLDTLKQLNEIKAEMDAAKPGINVKSLVDNAIQLQSNYYTQANALKDKKTRNIAIKDGNERVDPLVRAIQTSSQTALLKEQMRAVADERDKRLLPQFANGVFVDKAFLQQYGDFKRRNGLLPGTFRGKDTLPSMLAPGEMVLNPMQMQNIRIAAGYDIFKGKGIPNYAEGTYIAPSPNAFGSSSSAPSGVGNAEKRPIQLQLSLNLKNTGMVESDVENLIFESLDDTEFQVEFLRKLDTLKTRERN